MKITASKSELLKSINIVLKAVPSRTTMQILDCIYIEASLDHIKLTSNDQELTIQTILKGNIIEKGNICLEAKFLSEIVRKLPENDVTINVDNNNKATITCEKSKFQIYGKSSEEFPKIKMLDKINPIIISQFTLKELIRQTIFSISDNENNKLMTGELFQIQDNELSFVALDGHRISIRKIQLEKEYDNIKKIIPGKSLNEISKILTGEISDNVYIYLYENHILFEFDDTIVLSRLIEGEFYKINQMISKDYSTKIIINKKELYSCIDRALLFVKESDKNPLILNIINNNVELKVNSSMGSMDENIEIDKNGNDIKIAFNPKFIADALRVIDEENISIYFVNQRAPLFIRDDDDKYLYLILPVNFNEY